MRLLHGALARPDRWNVPELLPDVINTWRTSAPSLLPVRADDREPVRRSFDPDDLDAALPQWLNGLWVSRGRTPPSEASFISLRHGAARFDVRGRYVTAPIVAQLEALVLAMAVRFDAEYGMIHTLTDAESDEALAVGRPDVSIMNRLTGTTSISTGFRVQLAKGLDSIYWINILGTPHIELFGRSRLESAPWARHETTNRLFIGYTTIDPPSDETYADFARRRESIKDHLGRAAFWPDATLLPTY